MTGQTIKRRILFVDDEPNVLEGLRNLLRKMRDEWDMEFVDSGRKALDAMKRQPADIIVSDVRMPVMDGVQLLNIVKSLYPGTVRFILSGHSDRETVLRSVGPTHQFLAKPCDAEVLKAAVGRAFALRDLMGKDKLLSLILDVKVIPTVPELYNKVCVALNSPNNSLSEIGTIIAKDVAMSAKILQLVNSAFFGLRRRIGNMEQAVALLGIDTMKAIVMATEVFQEFSQSEMAEFAIAELYAHSVHVGNAALKIGKQLLRDQKIIDETTMAGMMHDLGKIIFIRNHASVYREILRECKQRNTSLFAVEKEFLGVTHAEVGAYILGLWGLSDSIVEAVAFHHSPSLCVQQSPSVLTAVYLANALSHRVEPPPRDAPWEQIFSELNIEYIKNLGIEQQLWDLAELARRGSDEGGDTP
jgi:HD-like signal output (HDOD) protein